MSGTKYLTKRHLVFWIVSVVVAVGLVEVIVSVMGYFLLGHVTWDYLLTGLVAAVIVAGLFNFHGMKFFALREALLAAHEEWASSLQQHQYSEQALVKDERTIRLILDTIEEVFWMADIHHQEMIYTPRG